MSDLPPRPADGWKMPPPSPIGTDTENDRLRQQQGQRPATAEDFGPLCDQDPLHSFRREPVQAAIKARIARLRREADGLDALLRSIPENLPLDADEALLKLLAKG